MAKSGIIAVLVGLAAVVLVIYAATSRQMSNSDFLIAAYVIAAVIIVGYIVSLTGRLDKAWRNEKSED
ncbi:MAG TPA: hypothetical protein VLC48_04280 [Gemmatimonadota bacterium]|nr:hypothetical protein [Gemmatimonadota bacterium]